MSRSPLAPASHPHYQSSSDPPISLCNSTTMSLPLAQLFCGMPPQIIPSLAPSINQPITDSNFILPLLQPTNQSQQDTAAHQPPPGSLSHLSSPLQHRANCLQAIHKTIQQINKHLKKASTDRHYKSLSFNCKMTLSHCATCLLPGWNNLQQRYCPQKLRYQSSD